jgi:lipopolysaccharide export system ATP-binding protein
LSHDTPPEAILEADGIGKSFSGRAILRNAGFGVYRGRITALMGRNGVGKSTLFRIVAGMIRADYGTLRYKGRHVVRPTLSGLARNGLMFCSQESVFVPSISVRAHFEVMIERLGGRERLDGVVSSLRLEDLLDRRPSTLSGGEHRRAALGLALLRDPESLLIDEPFAGVAPIDVPLITAALTTLRERGSGVAISGHTVHEIMEITDAVIWIVGGTTHWLGTPIEAKEHFQFQQEYLDEGFARRSPPGMNSEAQANYRERAELRDGRRIR